VKGKKKQKKNSKRSHIVGSSRELDVKERKKKNRVN
jgi:hypothetical protein